MNAVLALPRNVLMSTIVIIVTLLALIGSLLYFTSANGEIETLNSSLESQINQAESAVTRATNDEAYVRENAQRYQEVLDGDLLVPHTRRAALRTVQEYGFAAGLNGLNFEFDAIESNRAGSAALQVADSKYRVNVELVSLSVQSYLDRPIFLFVTNLLNDIPGASALKSLSIERAPELTTSMLNSVSEGASVGITSADIELEWRTAQTIASEDGP